MTFDFTSFSQYFSNIRVMEGCVQLNPFTVEKQGHLRSPLTMGLLLKSTLLKKKANEIAEMLSLKEYPVTLNI